ncbi:MAG: hypothetical protein GY869_13790, partial [Planctomycetes bacterium]|nr:hypothetical protein [Planctomycetota bacterium]
MGAYEYEYPTVIYVDSTATGGANIGTSWEDAFTSLQDGLDQAKIGHEIWVATGTYKPTFDYGLGIGDRGKHFRMVNRVKIFGGFAGGETQRGQRHVVGNPTVLSGDIGVLDDNSDNCYSVFYHPVGFTLEPNAVLDGFTITAGNADDSVGPPYYAYGGGMYNHSSSPTLIGCTFSDNYGGAYGGGMYNVS